MSKCDYPNTSCKTRTMIQLIRFFQAYMLAHINEYISLFMARASRNSLSSSTIKRKNYLTSARATFFICLNKTIIEIILARKSRLNNKLFFILIATLLFSTIIYLRSLDTQNVRGNWAPVVLIYALTMIQILLQEGKPEDHYKIRARKYSTPQARAAWYALQKERSKEPAKKTFKPPRLATAPRLSVPYIFLTVSCIFSIILFTLRGART